MMLFSGIASANADTTVITEKERLELANELWGTDITYGEYIQQLFPEAYNKCPDQATKEYYNMKVAWMDPSTKNSESEKTFTASSENTKTIYFGAADSDLSFTGSKITYKTWQRMVLPTPFTKISSMTILTHLWRDDGDEEIVGVKYKQGSNVYKLEAKGTYSYSSPAYYCVIGQYSGVYPAGTTPQSYNGVDSTGWTYVS